MTRLEARAYLDRAFYHMLDADQDGSDWEARQFLAIHMRQFPSKTTKIPNCPNCNGERELSGNGGFMCFFCGTETVPNETPKPAQEDGFVLS